MNCPSTGKPIYVGLDMDWGQLEALDVSALDQKIAECPHCKLEHRFEKNDLFLRADGAG